MWQMSSCFRQVSTCCDEKNTLAKVTGWDVDCRGANTNSIYHGQPPGCLAARHEL